MRLRGVSVACFAALLLGCDQGRRGEPQPLAITVVAEPSAVAVGFAVPLRARGWYHDGSSRDLTAAVAWSSSVPGVATVSNAGGSEGLATSVAVGTTTIAATHAGSSVSGATTLVVTPAVLVSLAVTPTNPSIALGTTRSFTATGTFSDNTTQDLTAAVAWSSSVPGVATVSNASGSEGLATSVAVGTTTITATHAGSSVLGATTLVVTPAVLVSLAVTPTNPSIALGTTRTFAATGTFSDNTTQDLTAAVAWSSSVPGVATVSNAGSSEGLATSVAVGTTTIAATHSGSSVAGATTLVVTPAVLVSLAVTPTNPSIALGTTQSFTATGTFSDNTTQDLTAAVAWSSSVPGVATVSNAGGSEGLATSVAVGTTTITATHAGSSIAGATTLVVTPAVLVSLAVTPTNPSIALGTTRSFAATGTFSDNTTQDLTAAVAWSSSVPGVATVSNAGSSEGLATSVAVGTTTIAATHAGSSVSGATTLVVTPAVLVSLSVTPTNVVVATGGSRQFTAMGTFSDSSVQDVTAAVTWSSSVPGCATISNAGGSEGLATGVAAGATTITATDAGTSVVGSTTSTVVADITVRGASSASAGSGGLSLSLATPAGTAKDDVLLAAIGVRPSSATITPPSGWTLVRRLDNGAGANNSLAIYRRVAVAGEPASHAWTFSASTGSAGGIVAFLGVDTGTPVDVQNGQTTGSSLSHTAPGITTSTAGCMLFAAFGFSSASSWTPPGGMTERFDVASEAPGATGITVCGDSQLLGGAGATGNRTAVAAADADTGNAALVALRRAP